MRHARAPMLLFLDADDWLYPEALEKMVSAFDVEREIIYTDYVGKAYIDPKELKKMESRLLYYDEKTQEAVLRHKASDFDCIRAKRQPDESLYIWCLITSLLPKDWHYEIGGFDESMESWEDWDYWIRMARAGKCFSRLPEELVVYRFYTGTRRDSGFHDHKNLIQYLNAKKQEEYEPMPCKCGGKKGKRSSDNSPVQPASPIMVEQEIKDGDLVLVDYLSLNRGQHKVVGVATKTFYGYRSGGERFYINKRDFAVMSHIFAKVEKPRDEEKQSEELPAEQPQEQPDEDNRLKQVELNTIPGITPAIAIALEANRVYTQDDLKAFGRERLMQIKGIGEQRANAIFAYLEREET